MKYEDGNRGVIQFRSRAKQIIDFSGLSFDYHITPTDIDGVIEYHALNCWAFMEFKCGNAPVPYGQKKAFERLVDNCVYAGQDAILLICRHDTKNTNNDINAADAIVSDLYWRGKWQENVGHSCRYVLDRYFRSRQHANNREIERRVSTN